MPHWAHIVLEVVVIGACVLAILFGAVLTLVWVIADGDK